MVTFRENSGALFQCPLSAKISAEFFFHILYRFFEYAIDGRTRTAHGSIDGTQIIELVFDGRYLRMVAEYVLLEIVCHAVFPALYGLFDDFLQRYGRPLRLYLRIGFAGRYGNFRFHQNKVIAFQREVNGLKPIAYAGGEHRPVAYKESTVGTQLRGIRFHLFRFQSQREFLVQQLYHVGCIGRPATQAGSGRDMLIHVYVYGRNLRIVFLQ